MVNDLSSSRLRPFIVVRPKRAKLIRTGGVGWCGRGWAVGVRGRGTEEEGEQLVDRAALRDGRHFTVITLAADHKRASLLTSVHN